MSGYDIKKYIEGSISNFWRESYGQLYPTLRRLSDEGLIAQEAPARESTAQERKPNRYLYRITPAGRKSFEAWLAEPPMNEVPRSELALKLFFGTEMKPAVALRHVRQRRVELEANLERLAAVEEDLRADKSSSPGLPYWLLTLRLGALLDEAHLEWCDEAERELELLLHSQQAAARRSPRDRRTSRGT